MRTLTILAAIVFFALAIARAQEWLAARGMRLDMPSFLAGVGVSAVFGWVLFRINNWHNAMSGVSKPQSVNTQTAQTPGQVTVGSIAAFFRLVVFLFLFVLLSAPLLQINLIESISQLVAGSLQ